MPVPAPDPTATTDPAPRPPALRWRRREGRSAGLWWDAGRFTVGWDPAGGGYVLYDRSSRTHWPGWLNHPTAQDWAERLAAGTAVPRRVGLVGCSALKLDRPAAARTLYRSPLFRAAARHAERTCDAWFVLSARHGLVAPDQVVAPYDLRLADLPAAARAAWGERVRFGLWSRGLLGGAVVECHAGREYVAALPGRLAVRAPLAGLGIGRRLAWYAAAR